MKWLLSLTLSVFVIVLDLNNIGSAQEKTESDPKYEKMLYDLGAFPVSKLTQPYWTNGNPGKVYSKGGRVDVDGWLPPHSAEGYLTEAERAQYGIPKKPLSYEQYMAMLDIDEYKRTHDPMLFVVMRFALECMERNSVPVQKKEILRVYEAKVGLEPFAVWLLRGKLSSADAMRLLKTYGDEELFWVLPAPQPDDKAYIAFLAEQASATKWSIFRRQTAYKLLFAVNENAYRTPYREFLLSHVKTTNDWWERSGLYDGLVRMKDEESMKTIREALVHDPITECREQILLYLQEQGEVAPAIDAILVVVNGQDDKPHSVTVARRLAQWTYTLNEYLEWAKSQKNLDATTSRKVDEAIEKLKAIKYLPDD